MSVNELLQVMSAKYKELRSNQIPIARRMLIDELRKIASQVFSIMQQNESPENSRHRRQIEDILKKCSEVEKGLDEKGEEIGNGGRGGKRQTKQYTSAEVSKLAVRSVVMRELRSSQLQIRPEQIEDIAIRMERNRDVMKEIQQMVHDQGGDLQRIEQYLEDAYENAEQANVELVEAQQIQKKTRLLKFRMAVSGFFGMLGYKILGLPGALMAFLFGMKTV